jgi:uncharacterized protein with FMN-binding domain
MRRIVIALIGTLSGLALLFSYHTSTNQRTAVATGSTQTSGGTQPGTSSGSATGSGSATSTTFTGNPADTRWGVVQVRITVAGGKVTAAAAVRVPNSNPRDVEINNAALPTLNQAVLAAQSATFDGVSGATVTSDGYKQSLQSALDQAHL